MFCEVMDDEEAIQIIGAEQFSAYEGYGRSLRYDGDFEDTSAREEDGTVLNGISAIDALHHGCMFDFTRLITQLDMWCMLRELNKALAGFKPAHPSIAKAFPTVATGNWGCGVYGGHTDLKALLQWMAASEAGVSMRYFPFNEKNLGNRLKKLSQIFDLNKITVGSLWSVLQTLSGEIHNNSDKKLPDRLEKLVESKEAFMQYIEEHALAT